MLMFVCFIILLCKAAEWCGGRMPACCAEGPGFEPRVGSPTIFKMDFHQQKLSSLSIAYDIKVEDAFYSVFYAQAGEKPGTSLNE